MRPLNKYMSQPPETNTEHNQNLAESSGSAATSPLVHAVANRRLDVEHQDTTSDSATHHMNQRYITCVSLVFLLCLAAIFWAIEHGNNSAMYLFMPLIAAYVTILSAIYVRSNQRWRDLLATEHHDARHHLFIRPAVEHPLSSCNLIEDNGTLEGIRITVPNHSDSHAEETTVPKPEENPCI